jgi:hypothetical protein
MKLSVKTQIETESSALSRLPTQTICFTTITFTPSDPRPVASKNLAREHDFRVWGHRTTCIRGGNWGALILSGGSRPPNVPPWLRACRTTFSIKFQVEHVFSINAISQRTLSSCFSRNSSLHRVVLAADTRTRQTEANDVISRLK